MARMTVRATYALDDETDRCIRDLAKLWDVSQAEVIRRSVRAAAENDAAGLSPRDVVQRYIDGPLPRSKPQARSAIRSLRTWRHVDDKARTEPSSK